MFVSLVVVKLQDELLLLLSVIIAGYRVYTNGECLRSGGFGYYELLEVKEVDFMF